MIGLHISKNKTYEENEHKFISKKCGDYNVTLSYHQVNYRQVFFEKEEIMVFIDGWIFNSKSYENQAEYVINMFTEYDIDFVKKIEGQFNLFLYKKQEDKAFFVNDIFSLRKHFISKSNFNISTDLKFLYSQLDSMTINELHIKRNLNQNRLVDIKETFIREIEMVTPASVINFKSIESYDLSYFEKKYSFESKQVTPVFFYERVLENIKEVHRNTSVLLQLSGGMDSRFLLECFNKNDINTNALIYGTLESDELIIAREVAKSNTTQFIEVEYLPEDYVTNAKEYIFNVGGLDIFVQSAYKKTKKQVKKLKNNNYIFDTGIGLNNFIGGTQIKKQFMIKSNNFSNDFFDLKLNDIYTSKLRIFSQLFLRQKYQREFMEDRYSMFSYKNYFLMKSIPLEMLKNYKFYESLAEISIKNSREINIQATMKPFYKTQLLEEKINLKRREHESLKAYINDKNLFPHNRYYSDFDMWIRSENSWNKLINNTIMNNQASIHKFIPKKEIEYIINNHNIGEVLNMRLIVRLISTELFLKETNKYIQTCLK